MEKILDSSEKEYLKLCAKASHRQLSFDRPVRLMGSRFSNDISHCDNCNCKISVLNVCVMKKIGQKEFRNIYLLCKDCKAVNSSVIDFFIVINS